MEREQSKMILRFLVLFDDTVNPEHGTVLELVYVRSGQVVLSRGRSLVSFEPVCYMVEMRTRTHESDPAEGGDSLADNGQLVQFFAPSVLLLHVNDGHEGRLGRADDGRVLRGRRREFRTGRCELDKVFLSDETVRDLLSLNSGAQVPRSVIVERSRGARREGGT